MAGPDYSALSTRPAYYATWLAGAYLCVAGSYILISGWLAAAVAHDVAELARLEHIKGIAFVFVTGALLWFISWLMFDRLKRANAARATDRQALMLVQSKAYAAELAASVAHDFNNLLLVVGFGLDEITAASESPPNPHLLAEMRQALDAARNLTERMARAARGQREIRRDHHSLTTLVTDTVHLVKRLPRMRGRNIEIQARALARALLDPIVVEQIVVNLLLNAADATTAGGTITVKIEEDDASVQLVVEDDGPGLRDSQIMEVLQPFNSTKAGGLGLGLLSVRFSAEATQGKLTIDRSTHGGARFAVRWAKPDQSSLACMHSA